MSYGLTSAGFVKKTLAVIRQELVTKAQAKYGVNVNVQPETPLGQFIDITAERLALLWEEAEAIYLSQNPDSAEGVNLDRVCALVGVSRLPELKSTVTASLIGTNGTVIPAGTIFQVGADTTNRFETLIEVTIPVGGTITVDCENLEAGAKVCIAGTLTTIITQISGLTSVNNIDDAVIGRLEETDAELRARRTLSLTQSDAGTLEAIRAILLELDGVSQASVFENTTNLVDIYGRPPHSVEAVVRGGADAEIAEAIWSAKPAGVATFGTDSENIVDSQGTTRTINFSRPTPVEIYVIVNITQEVGATVVEQDVKDAVIVYADSLTMGDDVLPISGIIPAVVNNISGIRTIEILADSVNPPLTSNPYTIAENEIAEFAEARITVNLV